jgi:hypothetical protein
MEDAKKSADMKAQGRRLREIATQAIDEVGRLARGLHPTVLDDHGLGELLRIMGAPPWPERRSHHHTSSAAPIWIQKDGHGASRDAFVTIACPECLRTFIQGIESSAGHVQKTECLYCHCLIHCAIVKEPDAFFSQAFRLSIDTPTPLRSSHSEEQYER